MPENPRTGTGTGTASLVTDVVRVMDTAHPTDTAHAVDLSELEQAAVRVGRLSDRERQVLVQLATGQTNHLIARRLKVSEGTVKVHVGHILLKLGLGSRTAAAVVAFSYLSRCPCRAPRCHECGTADRDMPKCLLPDRQGAPIQ